MILLFLTLPTLYTIISQFITTNEIIKVLTTPSNILISYVNWSSENKDINFMFNDQLHKIHQKKKV